VIYVAKPSRDAPAAFAAKARAELQEVLRLFGRGAKPKYKFSAYRHPDLKSALTRLFQQKCAYCEANYAVTGNMEVEHYRPKSVYYWLAADWSNLLPSCNRCNNGKRSTFPLRDPRRQARKKGEEMREDPLLLDPSDPRPSRRPEHHLCFDTTTGSIQVIAVRGVASPLGQKSIEVYRLTRPALSAARRDWATRVRWHVENCRRAARGTPEAREFAYQGLKSFLDPAQPFRALTLQILRDNGFSASGRNRT